MKITNLMNTKIFTWKPSDWEENHGSFSLTSEFPLPGLNTGWGNQPLRIYLWRTKTPLLQFDFPAATGRGTNPFKPTK